jgi:hypothetical protein
MNTLTREEMAEALRAVASEKSKGLRSAMHKLANRLAPATVEAHEAQAIAEQTPDPANGVKAGQWRSFRGSPYRVEIVSETHAWLRFADGGKHVWLHEFVARDPIIDLPADAKPATPPAKFTVGQQVIFAGDPGVLREVVEVNELLGASGWTYKLTGNGWTSEKFLAAVPVAPAAAAGKRWEWRRPLCNEIIQRLRDDGRPLGIGPALKDYTAEDGPFGGYRWVETPIETDWRSRSAVGEWYTYGGYFYEITASTSSGFSYTGYQADGTVAIEHSGCREWTDFARFTPIPPRPAERDGWRPKWEVKQFKDGEIPGVPFYDFNGLLPQHTGGVHGKRFDGWRWLAERVELTGLAMLQADKPGVIRACKAGAGPGVFVRQNGYIQYIPTYGVGAISVLHSPDIAYGLTNENCPVIGGAA